MSSRLLAALAAGLILLTTACSSSDKVKGEAAPSDAASPAAPKFTPFDEFPGADLKFVDTPSKPAARLKPVDSAVVPDLIGVPAEPGYHFVAVYMAVTGELADRGVDDVRLKNLAIKYPMTGGMCGKFKPAYPDDTACFSESYPFSDLAKVADNTWRDHKWQNMTVMGTDVKKGETMIGVAGFKVADTVDGPFELCAPSKEERATTSKFPCVPIKAPERSGKPGPAPQDGDFASYPGQHVVFTNMNEKLGVRVKPVDATWAAELIDKPAQPGFHFLGVYLAVTPDLADRGVENVNLERLVVRYPAPSGGCVSSTGGTGEGACFAAGRPTSQLDRVAKGEWRTHYWLNRPSGTGVKAGETLIGLSGFEIPDSITGTDFKLCAPTPENPLYPGTYPCVPITVPARG
ncbi:hypothetical protein SAMN05421504_1011128 [Amycolatopsis xylanica]|uniref:Uncharacterized protein n=1 Tax=Amycolatopsis xylanica TaxID=589385 RepID=A0A1H2V6L1_9PSEU|nr:hypothetical protein [Amycolatopsis xylanica]SDW63962.1 hypothetical protein SAMN05421504_1011128 [Amycolatopsis xylanica]